MGDSISRAGFTLKKEIDLGQILTALSIVISIVAFGYAWHNDRTLKEKEYADRVRQSASAVAAKLERSVDLSALYFENLQDAIVDVSAIVVDTGAIPCGAPDGSDKEKRIQCANRTLYKALMEKKATHSQVIVDEQIQLAYMGLHGYLPGYRREFYNTLERIRGIEEQAQHRLESSLQDRLRGDDVKKASTSAEVGNKLRGEIEKERDGVAKDIRIAIHSLSCKMRDVIQCSDEDLRNLRESTDLDCVCNNHRDDHAIDPCSDVCRIPGSHSITSASKT